MKIKSMARDCMLPQGIIQEGDESIHDLAEHFSEIEKMDSMNEMFPSFANSTSASPKHSIIPRTESFE